MMSKYSPLQDYLEDLEKSEWSASFAEIEKLIQGKLPRSAYEYPAWWSNNPTGHSHSRAWIEAGWMTEDVNIPGKTLHFRRISKPAPNTPNDPAINVYGFLKGSVTVLGDYDLTEPLGENWGLSPNE